MSLFEVFPTSRGLLDTKPEQFEQLLGTRPFEFIIGHDRVVFYIHRDLVLRLSAPLDAQVNGEAKESLEGRMTWEDVDVDIFVRFVQFVYTGDYASFAPAERESLAGYTEGTSGTTMDVDERGLKITATPEPLEGRKEGPFQLPYSLSSYKTALRYYTGPPQPSSKLKRKSNATACNRLFGCSDIPSQKKRDFISAFIGENEEEPTGLAGDGSGHSLFSPNPSTILPDIWRTKSAPETQSYEQVFIGHAKIWVFAEKYAIASLQDLATSYLVRELGHWTISPSTFLSDFGGLARYVYGNHTIREFRLRQIVAQFAACVVEDVSGLDGWLVLLNETPDFGADLVDQMINRHG